MFDYVRDPDEIYRLSFQTIQDEVDFSVFDENLWPVVRRLIHTCGLAEVASCIRATDHFVSSFSEALNSNATIITDCEAVAASITKRFLKCGNKIVCTLNNAGTPDLAKELNTTRSAAAVEYWPEDLSRSIIAIGNAPTTLFHLLEKVEKGGVAPAAIIGMPVGFVGAAESKELLTTRFQSIPHITLLGRMGGSPMAASVINALALESGK
jgi:precorrin-8X/cobalt-precorrin-8 methylmutase